MCCFSQEVGLVSDTNIFARGNNGSQFLVYQMTYTAVRELAMVLPLPVPPSCREDAVRFINLEAYPKFFEDLQRGFPKRSAFAAGAVMLSAPALKVRWQVRSLIPRRNDLLYFPTLHIHDGEIHQDAIFDHMLYCQPEQGMEEYVVDWNRSAFTAQSFMNVSAAQGIIAAESHVWRAGLSGTYENGDTLIGRQGTIPVAIRKTSANRFV